jgi:uncharacterized protein (PEP-CTERM system associated)
MARASSEAQRRFVRNLARFLPLSSALLASPTPAVKWELVPTLSLEEHYTDNVSLAPDGANRSEWATIATPGFNLNVTGRDWALIGSYGAQGIYRANSGTSEVNHQASLNSIGSIELYPQLLYLETRGGVSQQNFSTLAQQSADNVNTAGNRATVRSLVVSPFLRHSFGTDARAEARYTYSSVDSGAGALSDSAANRIDLRLVSGAAYKLMTWSAEYSKEVIDYTSTNNRSNTSEKFGITVRRLITPTFGLLGTVGYEEHDYATIGEAPKGAAWSVGVSWTPTPRTNLVATAGKRYFGDTYALDFSHRMRAMVFSAKYSEDVTTTRQQLILPSSASTAGYLDQLFITQFPDPILRQQAVQSFITQNGLPSNLVVPVEFFTNQFFLEKRWGLAVGFVGARHSFLTNYYNSNRESLQTGAAVDGSAGDFASSTTVKQSGASATWSWRITPLDASNLSVGYTKSESPGLGRETNLTYMRWVLNHRFGKDLDGALSVRRQQSDSNQGGTLDYTENAVTVSLKMSF